MLELLRAKSMSALCETPACPLVAAAAVRCLSITDGQKSRFVHDGYHKPVVGPVKPQEISPDTRLLFEQLYLIPVPVQIEVEQQILQGKWDRLADLIEMSSHRDEETRLGYLQVRDYSNRYIFAG